MLRALAHARKSGLRSLCGPSSLREVSAIHVDAIQQAAERCWKGCSGRAGGDSASASAWLPRRRAYSSGSAGVGSSPPSQPAGAQQESATAAAPAVDPSTIADLEAKLALLEGAGVGRATALARYTPYLCSPAHHIATRLAFLQARGKLRRPPRLWQVICPSDAEVCRLHGEAPADLDAFRRRHLASPEWAAFVRRHAVAQAQPEPAG